MIFLFLNAFVWLSAASAQQGPVSKPVVRPCADSWNDSGSKTKKKRPKSSRKGAQTESGACIELVSSTLEIQEYLQSYARAQQWKITADQMNEDSWTFSLEIEKDELLRDITDDSRKKRVEWTVGAVRVHVNTAQLPDGYARTIVRASFRGYGRPADQFAMEKEYWDLDSSNNFENAIVSALRTHFIAAPSEGTPQARVSPKIFRPLRDPIRIGKLPTFQNRHTFGLYNRRALRLCYFQKTEPASLALRY